MSGGIRKFVFIDPEQFKGLDSLAKWTRYRDGLCQGCLSYCCHLPVEVTIEDLMRLGVINGDDFENSPKKTFKKLLRLKLVTNFRQKQGLFVLSQRSDGSCIFLDEKRQCSVYDRRPNVCRRFPEIGPRPGYCPARQRKK